MTDAQGLTQGKKSFITGEVNINVAAAFAFGVIFVSVLLAFAVWFPNPTESSQNTFTTVLALAAGGIGAMLPGKLQIRHLPLIRASGAVAMFVIVYFFKPQIMHSVATLAHPTEDPRPAYEAVLKAMDSGNSVAIKAQLRAGIDFNGLSLEQMDAMYKGSRGRLGNVVERSLVSAGALESPPALPIGVYGQYFFRTKFANSKKCWPEAVILRGTPDAKWEGFGYQIGTTPVPCDIDG